ncbi:MAG: putative acetyltransferase [Candidatus Paceibacteria bacterium]|jgi:predicted acetyltransferase
MTSDQVISICPATLTDHVPLARMFTAYQRTIAAHDPSIDPEMEFQSVWLEKPGQLFPYMICRGGKHVGFILNYGKEYTAADGETGDNSVYAMYVIDDCRGMGVAERGLRLVLALHAGTWSVPVLIDNLPAMGFWKRVLGSPEFQLKMDPEQGRFVTFRITVQQDG